MSNLTEAVARPAAERHPPLWRRPVLRWLVSFAGFPVGGLAAWLVIGPVDGLGRALAGGLITGAILGSVQAWALAEGRRRSAAWVLATTVGLMAGLALGASLVQFRTGLGDLIAQGAVSGAVVGLGQAVVLRRLGILAVAWPVALGALWASGWAVTAAAGIQVEERFPVFGASGAVVVTVGSAVLPILIHRRRLAAKRGS
jgi:hypothetical protein